MVKIREATKRDIEEYLTLKKQSLQTYSKLINERIKYIEKSAIEEFNDLLKSKRELLLLIEDNNKIKGYLIGVLVITPKYKSAEIGDLFIIKEDRGKGYATALIKKFINICEKKSIKRFKLGVDITNKNAIKLYQELGFKLTRYEMVKKT